MQPGRSQASERAPGDDGISDGAGPPGDLRGKGVSLRHQTKETAKVIEYPQGDQTGYEGIASDQASAPRTIDSDSSSPCTRPAASMIRRMAMETSSGTRKR